MRYAYQIIIALITTSAALGQPTHIPTVADTVDRDFVPTTAGKKLLCYRGPVVGDDTIGFDGVITGGAMAFKDRIDEANQMKFAEKIAAQDHGRHTDNFYLCYCYPGTDADAFDWFDDMGWLIENWRVMAKAAKVGGFKGICFDSEYYAGLPPFGYSKMRHAGLKSYDEYRKQVFKRGAEIMQAINGEFPDIQIIFLFGYSGSYSGVPQHAKRNAQVYTLVAAFADGLASQCGPDAKIHDMHEQSFAFRRAGSFSRARAMMTDIMPEHSFAPDKYRSNHCAGFSFWVDCWENASQGRPFDLDTLDNNYYTPEEFAYSLNQSLAYSDKYVWMWPGVVQWWNKTARTVDADGKEVYRPVPQGYVDALMDAHKEQLPEPPRDRKPNTFRNMPAHTQQGWTDKETFDDLWETYTFVADLPAEWKFHPDWDEKGQELGWQATDFDDSDWPTIRIREFWENQGYSPYDGAGWYRLNYSPEDLPSGSKAYLAFGAVSDEASVYVNGKLLYASRYGKNMRHERFLVDVTDELAKGQSSSIVVRAWNTGWCGGIWKNVKLVVKK